MATRTSNQGTLLTRQKNVLGLKKTNAILDLPSLPVKVVVNNYLRDTTNKLLGLKQNAILACLPLPKKVGVNNSLQYTTNKLFGLTQQNVNLADTQPLANVCGSNYLQETNKKVLGLKENSKGYPQVQMAATLQGTTKNLLGINREKDGASQSEKSTKLQDNTNNVLGLKRKAGGAPQHEKLIKKKSDVGDFTNALVKKRKYTKYPHVNKNAPSQRRIQLTQSSCGCY